MNNDQETGGAWRTEPRIIYTRDRGIDRGKVKFASIDIGASTTRVGLLDGTGRIIGSTVWRTDPNDVMGPIIGTLGGFGSLRGIGICSAGTLSEDGRAIVRMSNTKNWNLDIVDQIEDRFGAPAILFNDCVAALLAERFKGAGRGSRNMAYVTLSTGVGAAVIDNDRLVFGKDGNAREIGHSKVAYDSKFPCGCGQYGCAESFIGGKSMGNAVRYLRRTKFRNGSSLLDRSKGLTAKSFLEISTKDRVARRIRDELGRILAIMVANINTLYDPEKVVIGGSVMRAHKDLFLGYISKWMPLYTVNRLPQVMVTELGADICLMGAGIGAVKREWVTSSFLPHP